MKARAILLNLIRIFSLAVLVLVFVQAPVLAQPAPQLVKYWPYRVDDAAVSADGRYAAAINQTTLVYFRVGDTTPRWVFHSSSMLHVMDILAVEMSANGEYVMIGCGDASGNGGISYFNESTSKTGVVTNATWTHWFLKSQGRIERGCTAMSDDGEVVAVAGTGNYVYYFSSCTLKIGEKEAFGHTGGFIDWSSSILTFSGELDCLAMTPQAGYVVAGGYLGNSSSYIIYLNSTGGLVWQYVGQNGTIQDIAISEAGSAVFAGYVHNVTHTTFSYGVLYWKNSFNLRGDNPPPSWWSNKTGLFGWHMCVDVSGDGNTTAAGDQQLSTYSVWFNSLNLSGENDLPDISAGLPTWDLAISRDGHVLAASVITPTDRPELLWMNLKDSSQHFFALDNPGKIVSISTDGNVIGVAGAVVDSLYILAGQQPTPMPVGGFDVPPNYLAVLLGLVGPWIIVAVAIAAVIAVVAKKTRKHSDDKIT